VCPHKQGRGQTPSDDRIEGGKKNVSSKSEKGHYFKWDVDVVELVIFHNFLFALLHIAYSLTDSNCIRGIMLSHRVSELKNKPFEIW